MNTLISYTCEQCGGPYQRIKGNKPGRFCSGRCSALFARPSQSLVIPDGHPMSARTIARRKKAAGLCKAIAPQHSATAFFAEWSDTLAWLVGLIWSDGNLYGNAIEVSSKDFQLMDLVMSVTDGHFASKNRGKHVRVYFSSKPFADFLRGIGLTEKKSLTIGWPEIPAEYEGAFMRGLIDGDGSVLLTQTRQNQKVADLVVQLVTASPNLRSGVEKWLQSKGIRHVVSFRATGNGLWKFSIVQQEALRNLFLLLYPDDEIACLHRKYSPYRVWMDTPRPRTGRTVA